MNLRSLLLVVLVALAVAVPAVAAACPVCALGNDAAGNQTWLIGLMLLVPFGIAAGVAFTVVRLTRSKRR